MMSLPPLNHLGHGHGHHHVAYHPAYGPPQHLQTVAPHHAQQQQHPQQQHQHSHPLNVGVHPASIQGPPVHPGHPQHYQHAPHHAQYQHPSHPQQHQQPHSHQQQHHHPQHSLPSPAPSTATPQPQQQQQQAHQGQGSVAPRDTTYSPRPSASVVATPVIPHATTTVVTPVTTINSGTSASVLPPINTTGPSVNGNGNGHGVGTASPPDSSPNGNSNVNGGANANAGASGSITSPLVAQGDWTKNLVQLAKTAELKKHALTLQLHTAHILSAHASLEQKNKALQDIKEQRNRLESERSRLLKCLLEVNEDRDKTDILEATIDKECTDLRTKIRTISDGEFATAKREVDNLRAELGQPPTPNLQQIIEERSAAYLNERRLGTGVVDNSTSPSIGVKRSHAESISPSSYTTHTAGASSSISTAGPASSSNGPVNGPTSTSTPAADGVQVKRPRGRPKGSKNKVKTKE